MIFEFVGIVGFIFVASCIPWSRVGDKITEKVNKFLDKV